MSRRLTGYLGIGFCVIITIRAQAENSVLWGLSGENWTSSSRLPDFSRAGYRAGQADIPYLPIQVDVKDEGAIGDGTTDDTQAFLKAIAQTTYGAVFIPAGRYVITQPLKISKNNIVLRGAGREKTILYFPKSLLEAVGAGKTYAPGGSWSWSGGFLYFIGRDEGKALTSIIIDAQRGDYAVIAASTSSLHIGQNIRIVLRDDDNSLGNYLYADQAIAPTELNGTKRVDFSAIIQDIKGNQVVLNRPLRVDINLKWHPTLYDNKPTVHDVGVEDLAIEFPDAQYVGHHVEPGYNAINFEGITDGWIRSVKIINADSGILLRTGTKYCTVQDIQLDAGPKRARIGYGASGEPRHVAVCGHHALMVLGLAQDNLFSNFEIAVRFIHDISLSAYSTGNVFSSGRGMDINFDHHRRAPYENLFSDIDAGQGTRLWEHGGDISDGPPGGARETFWNIRSDQPQEFPPWAIAMNAVAMTATSSTTLSDIYNWSEVIEPAKLIPQNIFLAQNRRWLQMSQ